MSSAALYEEICEDEASDGETLDEEALDNGVLDEDWVVVDENLGRYFFFRALLLGLGASSNSSSELCADS